MITEIENLVKEEKFENIILKVFLIIVCSVTIIMNSKEYKEIFLERQVIKNADMLKSAIATDERYVVIDLKEAKPTRFSLENNSEKEKAKIYQVSYGDENLLVMLKSNTALTSKIKGELIDNDANITSIANKLGEENDSKFFEVYFSDMDFIDEENIVKNKFYISVGIIVLLFLSLVHDTYKYFHPRKTLMYKGYVKRLRK